MVGGQLSKKAACVALVYFTSAISTSHSLPLAEISELSRSGKAISSGPTENNQPSINQIIFEDIKQTTEAPASVTALEEDNSSGTDDFPDRRGFFTGHRIPLELFPQDTLRRIELTSDEDDGEGIVVSSAAEALQTPPQPPQSTSLYVNSDDIRSSRGVARSLARGGESSLANQEILLGLRPETDTKYHGTLTSIVPIF